MIIDEKCICASVIDFVEETNDDFASRFETNCYCRHTSPPCSGCMHEGNPNNDFYPCVKCYDYGD